MNDMMQSIQIYLQWLGAVTGLGTLGYAIINMLVAQRRPTGQQTGIARQALRTPYLVIATVLFIILVYIFWKPLPIQLPEGVQLTLTVVGCIIMLPSLALYIWGLRTLGMNFNASSGFGVRLQQDHRLVIDGPYVFMRHPMYLGVILAFWGGLLLYRTWSMLGCAVMMLGLIYRGKSEEKALVQAFGDQWMAYKRVIPGWIPRIGRKSGKGNPWETS